MREYNIQMKAVELAEVDKLYHIHMQAFQNVRAGARKKAGKNKEKPAFPRFRQFFDYEDAVNMVMKRKKKSKFSGLMDYYRRKGTE